MTKTKLLLLGAAAVVAVVAYRRYKAVRIDIAPGAAVAAPAELADGGLPYGTTATTDVRKAQLSRTYVPAQETYLTREQNALTGIYS